jgi:hypothetical protein
LTNPQIVSFVIGLLIAIIIYWLVRRDHLAPKQALRWILVALIVLVLGTFPIIIDWLGNAVGIAYPPIIPIIIGLGAAMIKILLMDIERNKTDITQERLVQKLAMLEAEIEHIKRKC